MEKLTIEQRAKLLYNRLNHIGHLPNMKMNEIISALNYNKDDIVHQCAGEVYCFHCSKDNPCRDCKETRERILGLLRPVTPVWCEHIEYAKYLTAGGPQQWYLCYQKSNHSCVWEGTECPICGAPKPEVQP